MANVNKPKNTPLDEILKRIEKLTKNIDEFNNPTITIGSTKISYNEYVKLLQTEIGKILYDK
jgi:hypothetical protein